MTDTPRRPGVTDAAADAAALLGASIQLEPFRLAGGTALAWHLGHRLSEDLDFFSFPGGLEDVAASLEPLAVVGSVRSGENTLHTRVGQCSVSFFEVEGRWLDDPMLVAEGFGVATVAEIAAMKLVAVMTRCAKKDFYDLVAIDDGGIALPHMINAARRMYDGFDAALPHLRRALAYFDEAESDPDPLSTTGLRWNEVKRRIRRMSAGF